MIEGSNAGPVLCRLAAERGVDLLLVGGSDKGWFQRLIHGSVMEYAAHHAPCPVLIVRHGVPRVTVPNRTSQLPLTRQILTSRNRSTTDGADRQSSFMAER